MAEDEVVAAIGVPPGYQDGLVAVVPSIGPFGTYVRENGLPSKSLDYPAVTAALGYPEEIRVEFWVWEDYWIRVAYDLHGQVIGYYLLESNGCAWRNPRPSLFDCIRAWLGL
jgi:hypothetical protein